MVKNLDQVKTLKAKFHKSFGTRIIKKNHRGRRVDKAINTSNFLYRNWIHLGEFCVALLLSFSTIIFGNGNTTPNNLELVYPLQEVSTLECRTQPRDTLSDNCKIQLPIIENANYEKYISNDLYTSIYSVLFGGNYYSGRRTDLGSHYGVDIATAKGTPLYALGNGKVYFAGEQTGYGNVVKIEFVYQGIRYFAIYGHMDNINVKTGDSVSKGQRIGSVGNSGVTMGALGGYHVHFEIAKGDSGKPVYAFYGCSDISKGGITVINEGLCRTEMFNRTVDPIALLESAHAKLPHGTVNTENKNQNSVQEEHYASETQTNLEDREQIIKIAKLYLDSPYQLGGTGTLPGEPTDCSRFTQNVFSNVGIELERNSSDQAYQFASGGYWYDSLDMAEIGDLIFFKNTYNSDNEITHVGIYMGNNTMIHAGSTKVSITTLDSYWKSHFKGVGSFKYLSKDFNKEIGNNSFNKLNSTVSTNKNNNNQSQTTQDSINVNDNQLHNVATNDMIIKLSDEKLDTVGKQFFNNWAIQLTGDSFTPLHTGEIRSFQLKINKENGDTFNGILKQPIMFISNNTNISIDPVAISFIKNGTTEIKFTAGNQKGEVFIAVNMGTNRMGGFTLTVQ